MENYTLVEQVNSINLKHYSEICSNDHLCKTTNAGPPKQIPITSLLFNVTSNQNGENEKKTSKTTTTKLYPVKECKKT